MSLNKVIIMGNLTNNLEIKHTPSGKVLCSFAIANNNVYMKNNEKVDEVSYFNVEVWGIIAENCLKYLTKGSGVIVEGRLKQDRWEKDGKAHSHVKIVADTVRFLPKRQKQNAGPDSPVPLSESPAEEVVVVSSPSDEAWAE
jgi:single-strand DNA-binding protein